MTAVAEGAAVASAILSGELEDRDFFVSTEHALGTVTLDPGVGLSFSELIPRNHKLPARVSKSYTPVNDFQESLNVAVIEGDPSKSLGDDDNVILKEWDLELPEPQPIGELAIELTYSYDVDGILHVSAQDSLGNDLLDDVVSYGVAVDPRNLTKIARRASNALDSGRLEVPPTSREKSLPPEVRRLLADIQTKIIPFIDEVEAASLREATKRVESGDEDAVAELTAATRQYSYLL